MIKIQKIKHKIGIENSKYFLFWILVGDFDFELSSSVGSVASVANFAL
jgi:hypothetical protein